MNATAGTAETYFHGIKLSNDLSTAQPFELLALFLLLTALLLKPYVSFLNRTEISTSFWCAAVAVTYALKELTIYPLLTTIIYTRTAYPYLVVIPHCIASAAAYRSLRKNQVHYLTSFVISFFCYGFGGSIVSDVLMGLPVTALGHPRIVPSYVLGWVLVWFSPFDWVYSLVGNKSSFFRWFLISCEAVDSVTTPMGRISRSARELRNKTTAPLMAGLFAGSGGAVLRYGERVIVQGEVEAHSTVFGALEMAFWRTLGYSVIWWWLVVYRCERGDSTATAFDLTTNHCHEYNGSDVARVVIVSSHVIWTIACEAGVARGHPFVWAIGYLQETVGKQAVRRLRLGPEPLSAEEKVEKKD